MSTPVKTPPDGYSTCTAYLILKDAARAIEFYKEVFGACERMRLAAPDGKVMHAELQFGDSEIMLAEACPEMGARAPGSFGGSPVMLHFYVADVDATFARAVAAGAQAVRPVQNQFYGDRSGMLTDPFGHTWNLATHIEEVTPEEMGRRAAAMFGAGDAKG